MKLVSCTGKFVSDLLNQGVDGSRKLTTPRAKAIHCGHSCSGIPSFLRILVVRSFDGLRDPVSMRRKVTSAQPTWSAKACRVRSMARRCLYSHSPNEISSCIRLYQFLYHFSHYANHPYQ